MKRFTRLAVAFLSILLLSSCGYNALQIGLPQCPLLAHNRIPLRQVAGDSD